MARPGLGVDGSRRRTIRVVDECHRRASRTGRRPSQSGGQCLRSRVHRDGCPHRSIVANRTLLASLVATNVLGQNTPAIATTEAHYAEMWAQDAAAMYGYAGSSAAASTLTPFARAAGDHHGRSGSWHGNIGAAVAVGDFGPRCTARARLASDVDVVGIGTSGAFGFTDREFDVHDGVLGALQ